MSQVLQFECMSIFFSAIPLTCYTGRLDVYEFTEIFKILNSKIKNYFNTFQDCCWIFLLVGVMKISYVNIAM